MILVTVGPGLITRRRKLSLLSNLRFNLKSRHSSLKGMIETLFYVGVAVVTERAMTDPTNDGAIAGGIVAASLAVTLVLVLIIIFLCRRYDHAHLTHLIIILQFPNKYRELVKFLNRCHV